ncbi:MAG TPA: phosphodiester glycosidase family protein [bacterium]|nr:phosphodiester glycosidase family protein [bacterium]
MTQIKKNLTQIGIGTCCLFLISCSNPQSAPPEEIQDATTRTVNESNEPSWSLSDDWQHISDGMEIRRWILFTSNNELFPENTFVALRINPSNFAVRVHNQPANPLSVSDWQKQTGATLIVNGNFFDDAYETTGFLLIDGEKQGVPNKEGYDGMLYVTHDDNTGIRETKQKPYTDEEQLSYALQNFPLLVSSGGIPAVRTDSGKLARRSIIAMDTSGNLILLVTQSGWCSLYDVAQQLSMSDMSIDTAFNLDGGTSSGLSLVSDTVSYDVASVPVPNVIALYRK